MLKAFIISFIVSIFGFLTFVSPVLAGGSKIAIFADNHGWVSDSGFGRIVRVYLNTEFIPCKGTEITFKFAESKDGDNITTAGNSSTYIMQEDKTANGCSTYAKMTSKEKGERKIEVEVKNVVKNGDYLERLVGDFGSIKVDFDGQYHADNHRDGFSYRGSVNDPYGSPSATLTPTPKLQEQDGKVIIPQNPNPTISPSSEDNMQVEKLNQKVQNLQNQLDDSKKTQSLLEQRLNSIVSWIKSLFPFFK